MPRRADDSDRTPTGKRDEAAVREFVEHLALVLEDWTVPRMAGRVLGTLMTAEEDTLAPKDLADRLGVSPAAISGAARWLTQLQMIERVPVPGTRGVRYRVPHGGFASVAGSNMSLYERLRDLSDSAVSAVGGPDTLAGRRTAELRDFFQFVMTEFSAMMERWRLDHPPA